MKNIEKTQMWMILNPPGDRFQMYHTVFDYVPHFQDYDLYRVSYLLPPSWISQFARYYLHTWLNHSITGETRAQFQEMINITSSETVSSRKTLQLALLEILVKLRINLDKQVVVQNS